MAPKKTVATINKNLSFDNRKELSFGLIFDQVNYTAAATPELLALHQLQEILIKKMIAKIFNFKLLKYKVNLNSNEFNFSWKYWFLFEHKYSFVRKDIIEKKLGQGNEQNNIYSIVLETKSLQTKKPTKTSLIVITFDIDNSDESSTTSSCEDDEDSQITSKKTVKPSQQQMSKIKVNVIGTSHGIPKNHFDIIIETLKKMFETEMQNEMQLLIARSKDSRTFTQENKKQALLDRKREIDKIVHPEKYSKPKGRVGKNGEASGRYKPSVDAQSRRQKGGG